MPFCVIKMLFHSLLDVRRMGGNAPVFQPQFRFRTGSGRELVLKATVDSAIGQNGLAGYV